MKIIKMRMATTHIDKYGARLPLKALQALVDSVNCAYLPIIIEHDPRKLPIGRILSANLIKLDDGEYAVDGEGELFDNENVLIRADDKRELVSESREYNKFQICYDEYFLNSTDKAIISELNNILRTTNVPRLEVKKAYEPLCIFTIVASFAIVKFLSGIFSEMGKDAYNLFKRKISDLLSEKQKQLNVECLLKFDFIMRKDMQAIDVVIIMTNPSSNDIDDLLDNKLVTVARFAEQIMKSNNDIRNVVIEYSNKQLVVKYGMRKDAVPLEISMSAISNSKDIATD